MIGLPPAPCGGGGCTDMERFGRAEEGFPRGSMRPAHGIPGRDAFTNPFNAPAPGGPQRAMPRLAEGWGAIDGKALRRSFADAPRAPRRIRCGAFADGARPVSGQVRVRDKSNGIAAVPALSGMPTPKGNRGAPYEDAKPYPDDPRRRIGNGGAARTLRAATGAPGTRRTGRRT